MQKRKMLTLAQINKMAEKNKTKAMNAHSAKQMHDSLFWNRSVQCETPRQERTHGSMTVATEKTFENRLGRAHRKDMDKLVMDFHRMIRTDGSGNLAEIDALVKEIKEGGGDLDRVVNGWTALGISKSRGLTYISELLEQYGATKNQQVRTGGKRKRTG